MAARITGCDDADYASHFGIRPSLECDCCGEEVPMELQDAATHIPPDYMPESFRKRAATVLCERCRPDEE
jgi:hypothetical protein